MKKWTLASIVFFLTWMSFQSSSCRKETFEDDPGAQLTFSTDTILFDTVFTKLGGGPEPRSVNRRFTVRNPHNRTIKTSIHLGMGQASAFRINVDGLPVTSLNDYEIRADDSIYVFVEVTVDPNNQNNPIFLLDSVVFRTNGNTQDVKLVAWGQDAYYLSDSVLTGNIIWADQQKPYVIYNSILIDANAKLTILEGVKVYSSVNSRIFVNGTLEITGSKDNPVILQGARLEQAYRNIPSQWFGIRFLPASRLNKIDHAVVKNGVVGIEVDSLQNGGGFKLELSHTKILNMSAGGLIGYTAWIKATNVLSANCGQYTFLGELGGNYELKHCTFANYNTTFLRSKPAFGLSDADYVDVNGSRSPNNLQFLIQNTIVWGSLKEELVFFDGGQGTVTATIQNTLMRTETGGLSGNNNLINIDPKFIDYRELNFELDTLSPVKDVGLTSLTPPVLDDLRGELRDALPDIGAFERKE